MAQARAFLSQNAKWFIGDGKRCEVFSQPWFSLWQTFKPKNKEQREMKVSQLICQEDGTWDVDVITEAVGYLNMITILSEVQIRQGSGLLEDKLLFTGARNGNFTIKGAYRAITEQGQGQQTTTSRKLWLSVWNLKGVAPKVRIFVWKALKGALSVAGEIGRRMVGCDKGCKICGAAEETIIHMLFHCTIPRVVWFSSPLALRIDGIHDNLDKVLPNLWEGFGVMQKSQFAYLMWEIWKGRCAFIYGGKKQTAIAVRMAAIMGSKRNLEARGIHADTEDGAGGRAEVMQEGNSHQCWLDGSFSVPDQGGVGYWLANNEGLVQYGLKHFEAYSPFQMEAMALVLAMPGVRDKKIFACTFYSDLE